MRPKGLFIWVEGLDDARLFDVVLKPIFQTRYPYVVIRAYAEMRKAEISKFLKATPYIPADYIFVVDKNGAPCVERRKEILLAEFPSLSPDNIIVVVHEIESWYLAGLTANTCREFRIPVPHTTDNLQKQQFNNLMPPRFDSRIDWMREVLEEFSIETATGRNTSFRYFARKYDL